MKSNTKFDFVFSNNYLNKEIITFKITEIEARYFFADAYGAYENNRITKKNIKSVQILA